MKTITFDETKFALVPIEPTQQMLYKGSEAGLDMETLLDDTRFICELRIWQAMIREAPQL